MTKEPIMIDDVDVAECIHRKRKNENCTYCNAFSSKVFDFDCSDFPTCYYKQLKIKEKKCEFLNDIILLKSKENDYKKQQLDQLKVENEHYLEEAKKFKNCLTEIKEIAEPFCNACQEFEPEKKGRNCMYCNYAKILQKCEVIDG